MSTEGNTAGVPNSQDGAHAAPPIGVDGARTDAKPANRGSRTPSAGTETPPGPHRTPWFRLTVIILFALLYAYDLFEAISDTFGVAAQITKYNENATQIGLNTVAIPWAVLIANLLLPIVVFGLCILVARKRNVGVLVIAFLAGLGVIGALSLSLSVLAGVLT